MPLEIIRIDEGRLRDYATIPNRFTVKSVFECESNELSFRLIEKAVTPWEKDDSAYENPLDWLQWNLDDWGLYVARLNGELVGGAVVAWNSPEIHRLEGQKDIAALWDIRVHHDHRGRGVGRALFQQAVSFAKDNHCRFMKIETQNTNVPACRFYQKQGCILGGINRFAYRDFPDDILLDWYHFPAS